MSTNEILLISDISYVLVNLDCHNSDDNFILNVLLSSFWSSKNEEKNMKAIQ